MLGYYLLWFSVLIAVLGVFATSVAYLIRPTDGKLAAMRPLSLGCIFAAIGSLTAGWATVLQGAAATSSWTMGARQRLLMGASETLVPVFTAFGILAVSWVLIALGARRHLSGPVGLETGD